MDFPFTTDKSVDDESAIKFMQYQITAIAEWLATTPGPIPAHMEEAVRVYRYLIERLKGIKS